MIVRNYINGQKIALMVLMLLKLMHNYAANPNLSANFADHAEETILLKMVDFNYKQIFKEEI